MKPGFPGVIDFEPGALHRRLNLLGQGEQGALVCGECVQVHGDVVVVEVAGLLHNVLSITESV